MAGFYVFLSSGDSGDFYADNTPNEFTVNLRKSITLDGTWYVGLTQLKCQFESPPTHVNIECDICEESYVDNTYKAILATIYPKFKKYAEYFPHITYIPVNTNTLDRVRISIRGSQCMGQVYCVLHFKNGSLEKSFPYDGKW